MGIYYDARLLVGYRIDTSKLTQTVMGNPCSHDIPKNVKFCPECGVKNKKREKIIRSDKADEFLDFIRNDMDNLICAHLYDDISNQCWIGEGVVVDQDDFDSLSIDMDFNVVKERIKLALVDYLDIIELKDEEFRIWLVNSGS